MSVWGGGDLGVIEVNVWTLSVDSGVSLMEILQDAFYRILRIRIINLALMDFERLILGCCVTFQISKLHDLTPYETTSLKCHDDKMLFHFV